MIAFWVSLVPVWQRLPRQGLPKCGCLQAELRASKQAVALARRNAAAPAMAAASGADVPVAEAGTSSSKVPDLRQADAAEDKHQEDGRAVVYATNDMYVWEDTG